MTVIRKPLPKAMALQLCWIKCHCTMTCFLRFNDAILSLTTPRVRHPSDGRKRPKNSIPARIWFSGEKMKKRFDIFWFGENGPNWIDAVETVQTAKEQIEKLPQNDSGSYAVVDHRTGNRLSFATKLRASGARTKQSLPF
jgi:hypothetical protein